MRRDGLLRSLQRAAPAPALCCAFWLLAAPAHAQEPAADCVAPEGTEDAAQWFRDEGTRLAEQQAFEEIVVRDAIAAFECAARLDPEDIQSLMAIGALSYGLGEALGDLDAAEAGLTRAIEASAHQPLAQARLLAAHARIVAERGDEARSSALLDQAAAAVERIEAPADAATALMELGQEAAAYNDPVTTSRFAQAAESLYAELGDLRGRWQTLQLQAEAHRMTRDRRAAEAVLTQAHELAVVVDDPELVLASVVRLGDLAASASDYVKACPLYDQATELASAMSEQEASQAIIAIAARKGTVGCDLLGSGP